MSRGIAESARDSREARGSVLPDDHQSALQVPAPVTSGFQPAHTAYASDRPVNGMSVDVEDYFQVSAFDGHIPRSAWGQYDLRVERNTDRILELFDRHGVKATFFTLGWIAERFPALVRRIAENGHELASHGWGHVRAFSQSPAEFREDVTRTRKILEDTAGVPVIGYRAASYSIDMRNLWALDELAAAGYRYSSSIYPGTHDHYGMPDAPRFAFHARPGGLLEVPVTTVEYFGRRFPCGGGGWFRLMPYALYRRALRRVNDADRQPGIFYFHPWEIDPEQPRIGGLGARTRVRHYLNLGRVEARLERLLTDFTWNRMDAVFLEAA